MIGIEFIGGLGNALFQFGFIYSLAKKFDCNFTITNLESWTSPHQTVSYDWFKNLIYNCPNYVNEFYGEYNQYTESHPFVLQHIEYIETNTLFKGYYQCVSYIDSSVYKLIFESLPVVDVCDDAIFIHVRLGDYINIPEAQLRANYYKDALALFSSDIKKHVFSNDVIGAQNIVPDADLYIDADEVISLALMARYTQGGICANSSFSWWASQLDFSPNKIIVMPQPWGTKMPEETIDLYPKNVVLV
jgi:hypothetical protein